MDKVNINATADPPASEPLAPELYRSSKRDFLSTLRGWYHLQGKSLGQLVHKAQHDAVEPRSK